MKRYKKQLEIQLDLVKCIHCKSIQDKHELCVKSRSIKLFEVRAFTRSSSVDFKRTLGIRILRV